MNKKLLALAIGAAIAMPVAALAEGPTLYGQIDLSLENFDNGAADLWTVENNASRIGVKGSADTGVSGLQGIYRAEFGVDADDGASPFTGRNIYAGLKGDFGTILLGNIDTPLKSAQGPVDQFNDTRADMAGYVAGELRARDIVAYATPKIGDAVTVTVALWQSEGAPLADNTAGDGIGDAVSASVVYENEGLYLALAMDQETPNIGDGDLSNAAGGVDLDAFSDDYHDILRAVAAYSTDSFEVGFLFQSAEGADTPATNAEDTSMVLSGAYKTGDWKFKAQYGQTEGDGSSNTLTALALGADYAVGKSTTLKAMYAAAEDDAGLDDTLLSFGIKQMF